MSNHQFEMTGLLNAQKEMRSAFLGGFAGQMIAGLIWVASAAVSMLSQPQHGMLLLFFGCMGIFPLTQLTLRMMGRSGKVSSDNGLWALGSQVAFTVPLNFLLVGVVILYRQEWFYPAAMIVVGTHYLPFITLYGMKIYGVLAALLVLSGLGLALYGPSIFSLGGWITGLALMIVAFVCRQITLSEEENWDDPS
jgi:hypothetical protein